MSKITKSTLVPEDQKFGTSNMLRLLDRYLVANCPWSWTSEWLHANVRTQKTMAFADYLLTYEGQSRGSGTEHLWGIVTQTESAYIHLKAAIQGLQGKFLPKVQRPRASQSSSEQLLEYHGLYFRSEAEIAIAQALEAQGILFFANARCRLTNRLGVLETRETDFLVQYQGQIRILEVDGREFHTQAAVDHKRDRMFERYGLRTYRFTAKECLNAPEAVVEEFLELFIPKIL